jgi:hypothetical protein
VLCSLVEAVNAAVFVKINFTRMMGSPCCGVLLWCIWSAFNILSRGVVLFCRRSLRRNCDAICNYIRISFYYGVWSVDLFMCFVYSCTTYIFGACVVHIFIGVVVSCIFDVILAECRIVLNLLYRHVEFNFVGLALITLHVRHSHFCIFTQIYFGD